MILEISFANIFSLPVILSIENHCKLTQQRRMAAMFVEIFGGMAFEYL